MAIPEIADYEVRRELLRADKKKGLLAAQAVLAAQDGDAVVVATTNVVHLSLLVNAQIWEEIE